MATKQCIICGADFYAPPTSKKITCSKECSTKRKSQTHMGKSHPVGEETRKKSSARMRANPDLQKRATEAALKSPISGPFETNRNARIWHVVAPDGTSYMVRNLSKWCRDNATLFAPDDWQHALGGFRTLNRSMLGRTPRPHTQWKGWTLERPSAPVE